MICPHCAKDTPATSPYCQSCGRPIDLTFDKVKESFVEEAESRAARETSERCRFYLLTAATVLAVVIAARVLLVPAPAAELVLPAYVVSGEPPDAPAPVEPVPLELPDINIPK